MTVGYFGAILSLIGCIYGLKKCKKLFNPISLFLGLWSIILFLSSMQLYDLKYSTEITYFRLLTGIVCFTLGFWLDYRLKIIRKVHLGKSHGIRTNPYDSIYMLRSKYLLYFAFGIVIFMKAVDLKDNLIILLSGGNLQTVRNVLRANNAELRRTMTNVIHNLLSGPFEYVIYPIGAYNIINQKNKGITIATVIALVFGIINTGGRAMLIYFILSLLVAFTFSSRDLYNLLTNIKRNINAKKRYKKIIFLFIIFFFVVSFSRSGVGLLRDSYYYFAMEPTMFEQWCETVENQNLVGYGIASFNGFTFHILYLIKNILNISYPMHWNEVYNMVILSDTRWLQITNAGLPANAFVSMFWFMFLDGREMGIIIISVIYGVICSYSFRNAVKSPNIKTISIYAMILFGVFDSYVRMKFFVGDYAGGLLILLFIMFKKKKIFCKENIS